MKIRTQLNALVAGVMTPLVLLVALVTYTLWNQQREVYQQRFVERVSALRLALDTELDGIVASLAASVAFDESTDAAEPAFRRRFGRLLASYPEWSAITVADASARPLAHLDRAGTEATPTLGASAVSEIIRTRGVVVSGLQTTNGDRFLTYVAVPVFQGDGGQGVVVYATIEHAHWLRFLKTYPISAQATLTLNDRDGVIIARTLNDAGSVGQRSTSSYLDRTTGKNEDAFQSSGLEGQAFYTAFSRSRRAGWLLGTGVPRQEVESALLAQTLAIAGGAVLALVGAFAAALLLGRHINTSLTALQASASSWPTVDPGLEVPLPIGEAETVRRALSESGKRMLAHEESLSDAVRQEASAREAAESGNRAKDAFLAMLGHELRNPLSAISSATAVLSSANVTAAVAARMRSVLARQTAHLRQLLGDLIDTAELTKGNVVLQKSRVDLAALVQQAVTRFTDTERCSHLRVRLDLRPAYLEADPRRLEQVVSHLLDNACKYTPAGGTVSIEVRAGEGNAVLRVTDDGAGIAADFVPRMFELFAQGSRTIAREQGGLGLGLTTVKGLVDLHDGRIEVASGGLGKGATFTVTLPGDSGTASTAGSEVGSPRLRLTIVEDLPDSLEVMQMLLSTADRLVNVGADGPSGVAAILQGPSDAAIVDIGLPGFDGYEVARRVRQAPGGSRILLIALTGYGTAEDRKNAIAAGFDDFLVKPFDPALFESTLTAGLQAKTGTPPG